MPRFSYKGTNLAGAEVADIREAKDKFELAKLLHEEGVTVLSITEQTAGDDKFAEWWSAHFGRVKLKEKIIFANNLSAMISAGLALSRALSVIERQTKNKTLKTVVHAISDDINRGQTLAHSLGRFPDVFPPIFSAMVNAGEESGKLSESLAIIQNQLEKTYELRRKVRGAMIYPTIIVCVIFVIGYLMMVFLVPTLSATFRDLGAELPPMTRLIIAVSDFLTAYSLIVVPVLIVTLVSIIRLARTKKGHEVTADIILRLPIFGVIVRQSNSAVTMRTLSSLISSGVSMVEAIRITGEVLQNPRYVAVMKKAGEEVQAGAALSTIFTREEYLYPILVGEMAEVGEETGKLSEMLLKAALFYEGEIDAVTKNLSTIIEPLLMVFIGIAVGFFAVSMIQPMYSLSDII
jgi:type IV pilus assembly protein PilC